MLLVNNEKENLKIFVDIMPVTGVKSPLKHTKEELKKPYLNCARCIFTIHYGEEQFVILCEKGYDWDGASIPYGFRWIIGAKGSPEFLIPSMVHDKLCENHEIVKNNRYLSSVIFRELLLACGVGKIRANIMFGAVDTYQKICGGWK